MHASVGDQEGAGDAIDRHVRQRRRHGAEQFGAVGLAVGLAGLDHADFEAGDFLQAVDKRPLGTGGFVAAIAEILARALVDHDGGHRRQRFALLARE